MADRASVPRAARLALVALFLVCACLAAWRLSRRLFAENVLRSAASMELLEQVVRLDPSSAEGRFRLGVAYRDALAEQDLARAREELERAVGLHPYQWRYRVELAWLHELDGRLDLAERELAAAVRLNPHAAEYRWRLGNFHLRRGDVRSAAAELVAAAAAQPGLAAAGFRLALKTAGGYGALSRAWPEGRGVRLGLLRLACAAGRRAASPELVAFVELESSLLLVEDPSIAAGEGAFLREWLERPDP